MSAERDVNRIVRSWMDEGVTALPDTVLDAVLDQLPATPQRRSRWPARRDFHMNKYVAMGLGVTAAVVAFLIVGQLFGQPNVVAPPAETPEPSGSPAGFDYPDEAQVGPLEAGTYSDWAADGTAARLVFTVPDGWAWGGGILINESGDSRVRISIWGPNDLQVYTDPCNWSTAMPDPPTGPTAEDLVSALAVQPMRNASTPSEIAVDGTEGPNQWSGMAVALEVPEDIAFDPDAELFSECDEGEFRSWARPGDLDPRLHQDPGQMDLVTAIDLLDSERLVLDVHHWPDTPAAVEAEIQAILDSIVIGY